MNRYTWAKVKRSGHFKRKVKNNYTKLLTSSSVTSNISLRQDNHVQCGIGSVQDFFINKRELSSAQSESVQNNETLNTESVTPA